MWAAGKMGPEDRRARHKEPVPGTATRISGSLSCGAREVRSPCAWRGGARHCSRVMVVESGLNAPCQAQVLCVWLFCLLVPSFQQPTRDLCLCVEIPFCTADGPRPCQWPLVKQLGYSPSLLLPNPHLWLGTKTLLQAAAGQVQLTSV